MSITLRKQFRKGPGGERVLVTYYADAYERDRGRKFVSLHTKSAREARQKFADLERRYELGTYDPWEEGVAVASTPQAALDQYIAATLREGMRPKTIKERRTKVGAFLATLPPGLSLGRVRPQHVRAFIDGKDILPATKANYHTLIGAFFKFAVRKGYCRYNPVDRLEKPRLVKGLPKFMTREQVDMVTRAIEADYELKRAEGKVAEGDILWLVDAIHFALYTGMRLNELCRVRWRDVDEESGLIYVRGETKTRRERAVPLVPQLRPVLEKMRPLAESDDEVILRQGRGQPISYFHTGDKFRMYRDLARLPKTIKFHSLRHTYASWLRQEGVDLQVVKEALGHQNIRSTMVYAHIRPDDVHRAVCAAFERVDEKAHAAAAAAAAKAAFGNPASGDGAVGDMPAVGLAARRAVL